MAKFLKEKSPKPSQYAKHDAVLAPTPIEDMPRDYYLESNLPYAKQAGELFAERTARMMTDSLGKQSTISPETMAMYAKSGTDYYMQEWHNSGRDIERQIRDDAIRIGGHEQIAAIDARMKAYPDVLKARGKDDMLGACERDMFEKNVGEQVSHLKGLNVQYRAAVICDMRAKNGEPTVNPLVLQHMWKLEAQQQGQNGSGEFLTPGGPETSSVVETPHVVETPGDLASQHQGYMARGGRKLPSMGEELLAQDQQFGTAGCDSSYGDFGDA